MSIDSSAANNSNQLLNKKVQLILVLLVQFDIASFAFLLFKAKTIDDFSYSYCVSLTLSLYSIIFTIIALKMPKIYVLIDQYDEFIRNRKFKSFILVHLQIFIENFSFKCRSIAFGFGPRRTQLQATKCEIGTNIRAELFGIT